MATQPHTPSAVDTSAARREGTAPTGAGAPDTQSLSQANACPAIPGGFFGARFSLYPMSDRFVPIILHAIEGLRETGLEVETDDVSTFLGGPPPAVFDALRRAFARAASSGEHVVMTALFSYG